MSDVKGDETRSVFIKPVRSDCLLKPVTMTMMMIMKIMMIMIIETCKQKLFARTVCWSRSPPGTLRHSSRQSWRPVQMFILCKCVFFSRKYGLCKLGSWVKCKNVTLGCHILIMGKNVNLGCHILIMGKNVNLGCQWQLVTFFGTTEPPSTIYCENVFFSSRKYELCK